jgi:MATE family multidrug resistance protein
LLVSSPAPLSPPLTERPQGPVAELLILAAPMILMMITRMAMGFIDFVMVSQLGTEAQAAIGPASIFVFILASLGMGVAQAVQTFVSQADGRGEPHLAGSYAWQSLYVALLTGLVAAPAALTAHVWFPPIAALGKHSAAVTALEIEYIQWSMWLIFPATFSAGLQGFFNGIQRPRYALYAVFASIGANVLGNWLLIFGNLGFPAMGIKGAAIATVIGWAVRAAVMLWALCLPEFDDKYRTRHSRRLEWGRLSGMFRIGGPTAVQWLIDIGAWSIFVAITMPLFGTAAQAAANVAQQYMSLAFMPAIGLGMALTSQVGFAIGEGRLDKAEQRVRVAMALTGIYMGVLGLAMFATRGWLMGLMSADPEVIRVGGFVLIWAAIFQVFDAMGITYMSALRGAGDTRWPAIFIGLTSWVFQVVGAYAVARLLPQWSLNGPWLMCTLYIIIVGVALLYRWQRGHWRDIRLFDAGMPKALPVDAAATDGTAAGPVPAFDVSADAPAEAGALAGPAMPREQ